MTEVHILVSGEGEYSDRSETPVAAFASEAEAERVCRALNALCAERDKHQKTATRNNWMQVHAEADARVAERAAALLPPCWRLACDYRVETVPVIT